MSFKIEKDYQNHVMKNLRGEQIWLYKIPDVNMQIKPFDIVWVAKSIPFAIELKICDLKKWLTYEQAYWMLRPNQVAALQWFSLSWWLSWLWVRNKAEEKEYQFPFRFLDWISTEL